MKRNLMNTRHEIRKSRLVCFAVLIILALVLVPHSILAADRLVGIHSARVLSQSIPWIAQEAGLFKKYDLDFQLVYIASSPAVTAAMLGGDAEIALTGGEGMTRAYVQGATDFVFIGAVKNVLTHSILGKPEMEKSGFLTSCGAPKASQTYLKFSVQFWITESEER